MLNNFEKKSLPNFIFHFTLTVIKIILASNFPTFKNAQPLKLRRTLGVVYILRNQPGEPGGGFSNNYASVILIQYNSYVITEGWGKNCPKSDYVICERPLS